MDDKVSVSSNRRCEMRVKGNGEGIMAVVGSIFYVTGADVFCKLHRLHGKKGNRRLENMCASRILFFHLRQISFNIALIRGI